MKHKAKRAASLALGLGLALQLGTAASAQGVPPNTLRLAGRASIMAIRFAASVALAGLALIGLAALIYPDTRLALLGHAVETMNQLIQWLPA